MFDTPPDSAFVAMPEVQINNLKFTPIGPPLKESKHFVLTQQGGTMLVSLLLFIVFLVPSVIIFGALTGLIKFQLSSSDHVGGSIAVVWIFLVFTSGGTIIALIFLVRSVQDIIRPPVQTIGTITRTQRTQTIKQIQTKYGSNLLVPLYAYVIDFKPDDSSNVITFEITEEQYTVAQSHKRAFIIYSRKLRLIQLYQPIA